MNDSLRGNRADFHLYFITTWSAGTPTRKLSSSTSAILDRNHWLLDISFDMMNRMKRDPPSLQKPRNALNRPNQIIATCECDWTRLNETRGVSSWVDRKSIASLPNELRRIIHFNGLSNSITRRHLWGERERERKKEKQLDPYRDDRIYKKRVDRSTVSTPIIILMNSWLPRKKENLSELPDNWVQSSLLRRLFKPTTSLHFRHAAHRHFPLLREEAKSSEKITA